jgi:hypothetical protein
VDFRARLKIIGWGIKEGGNFKKMAIKAIGSALENHHAFSYVISGAEKQGLKNLEHYQPKDRKEIQNYWISILRLLRSEILQKTDDCYDLSCEILTKK